MRDIFKLISWTILIVGWLAAIVRALIHQTAQAAVGLGIVAAVTWVAWAIFLAWLFGVRRRARRFLGQDLKTATYQEKEVSVSRVTDIRRVLEHLMASDRRRYGVDSNLVLGDLLEGDSQTRPLKWNALEVLAGTYENYPINALYFLEHGGQRFLAMLAVPTSQGQSQWDDEFGTAVVPTGGGKVLQILSESIEAGSAIIDAVMREAAVNSVYRNRLLHVSPGQPGMPGQTIRVVDRPQVDIEKIILPPDVLQVLERGISTRLKHHALLERHGHSSKTGVLLHGPPGTGKTLMSKYLVGAWDSFTAIAPTGMEAETIRESFRMAAYLQPSLVVIEDVDLLAERRETNANVTGLQELMNEMDGLAASTQAIVIMTTNRPEILEPALASRPGRVSQAIHFPLPDSSLRQQLIALFCGDADCSGVDVSHWVERTNGASPAFVEELVRRAIIFAAERQPDVGDGQLSLVDEDFDRAIHELVVFGGQLTTGILGFPESDPGSQMV